MIWVYLSCCGKYICYPCYIVCEFSTLRCKENRKFIADTCIFTLKFHLRRPYMIQSHNHRWAKTCAEIVMPHSTILGHYIVRLLLSMFQCLCSLFFRRCGYHVNYRWLAKFSNLSYISILKKLTRSLDFVCNNKKASVELDNINDMLQTVKIWCRKMFNFMV